MNTKIKKKINYVTRNITIVFKKQNYKLTEKGEKVKMN